MIKKKKVLICTPSHDGKVQVAYMLGCLELLRKENKNYSFDWFIMEFASDIMKGRNSMFWNWYYSTTHDYLLFIDSDEGFTAEVVNELLTHSREDEISGAPVPLKSINEDKVAEWIGQELQDRSKPTIDLQDMLPSTYKYNFSGGKSDDLNSRFLYPEKLGTGFMVVPRKVGDIMIDYFDTKVDDKPPIYTNNEGQRCYSFFSHIIKDGKMLGEDYSFCIRAQMSGVKVKVDSFLNIEHYGTFKWNGNLEAQKRSKKLRKKLAKKLS